MICLRSQLYLENEITAGVLWDIIRNWRRSSKNTPQELKNWFLKASFESLEQKPVSINFGGTTVSILKTSDSGFAFKLTEGPVITTICFNLNLPKVNFSMEIERPSSTDFKISRPKLFDFLAPYLNNRKFKQGALVPGDYGELSEYMRGSVPDSLVPVIYISRTKGGDFLIDPDTLAKELFGIARVYSEPNTSFSKLLSDASLGRSAYRGAVGIYHKETKIIIRQEELKNYDFFYRLSKLSIKQPFSQQLTWYGITMPYLQKTTADHSEKIRELHSRIKDLDRLRDIQQQELSKSEDEKKVLKAQTEELKKKSSSLEELIAVLSDQLKAEQNEKQSMQGELERIKRENQEYCSTFDLDIQERDIKIDELTREVEKLRSYEAAINTKNKGQSDGINISVKCSEKPLFPGEIEDFLKGILYAAASGWKRYNSGKSEQDKSGYPRICDIFKAVFLENPDFDYEKSKAAKHLKALDAGKDKSDDDEYAKVLEDTGFYGAREKSHRVLFFHGDKRYSITAPKTHGDPHSIKNNASQAKKCIPDVSAVRLP